MKAEELELEQLEAKMRLIIKHFQDVLDDKEFKGLDRLNLLKHTFKYIRNVYFIDE